MNKHLNIAVLVKRHGKVYRWKVVGAAGKVYAKGSEGDEGRAVAAGRRVVAKLRGLSPYYSNVRAVAVLHDRGRVSQVIVFPRHVEAERGRLPAGQAEASIGNAPKVTDPHGEALKCAHKAGLRGADAEQAATEAVQVARLVRGRKNSKRRTVARAKKAAHAEQVRREIEREGKPFNFNLTR